MRPSLPFRRRLGVLLILGVTAVLGSGAEMASPPPLMLANVYHGGIALQDYWVSEKYDGVRAFWDGERLLTRGGNAIAAPTWFTAGWPKTPLDGELWAGRGRFAETVSTVRRETPDDAAWRAIRFMAFDLPADARPFDQRIPALQALVDAAGSPALLAVEQFKVADDKALRAALHRVVATGGEGLVLHRGGALYRAERNDDLLKLKPYDDAEARVIGHIPGQGKHRGRLGALLVETSEGRRFRLGTGFSDADRQRPPAVGSWVTYRYRGTTAAGLPRFASYLRRRDEDPADWRAR